MRVLKDYRAAIVLSVLAVLASLIFGVYRSVSAEAEKIETMFYEGTDGSGYGIAGDLNDRIDCAEILVTIAGKYGAAPSAVAGVNDLLAKADTAQTPSQKYDADTGLERMVRALDLALADAPLSEQDEEYRGNYMAMFESCGLTLAREAENYNAQVRAYEARVLGGIPVKLFGALAFLPDVEAFE